MKRWLWVQFPWMALSGSRVSNVSVAEATTAAAAMAAMGGAGGGDNGRSCSLGRGDERCKRSEGTASTIEAYDERSFS